MAADRYVDSSKSDANNGTSWALAKATLAGAANIDTAGDSIFVAPSHAESANASQTHSWAGTLASPTVVMCAATSAEPPADRATGAVVATGAGAYGITINGHVYVYGLTFKPGVLSSGIASILLAFTSGSIQTYERCAFWLASTGAPSVIQIGASGTPTKTTWVNCDVKFGATGQSIALYGAFVWRGGAVLSGGQTPNYVFKSGSLGQAINALIEDVDFSALNSTPFVNGTSSGRIVFKNCKMPASWNPEIHADVAAAGLVIEYWGCYPANAPEGASARLAIREVSGPVVVSATDIYRTGGAETDGTPFSWRVHAQPRMRVATPPLYLYNTVVGVPITLRVDVRFINSPTALVPAWLEVEYFPTSGQRIGEIHNGLGTLFIPSTVAGNTVPSGADDEIDTAPDATWVGSGSYTQLKITRTVTPAMAGLIAVRVIVWDSFNGYIDPMLRVE